MTNTDLLSSEAAQAASPIASSGSDASSTNGSNGTTRRKAAGLSGMVLPELRELAGQLGITGITGMRKGDLIAAIKERQGASSARSNGRAASRGDQTELPVSTNSAPAEAKPETNGRASRTESNGQEPRDAEDGGAPARTRRRRSASRPAGSPEEGAGQRQQGEQATNNSAAAGTNNAGTNNAGTNNAGTNNGGGGQAQGERRERSQGDQRQGSRQERTAGERPQGDRPQGDRPQNNRQDNRQGNSNVLDDDDERGGRRGRRFRDRRRGRGQDEGRGGGGDRGDRGGREGRGGGSSPDTEIREDDVLLSVGGILDVLENYAFVRTSGYLSGPSDVYVSLSLVRKYGLRRGDAITGAVRQPRDGEQQRQKFNPLVRVDSINGMDPEASRNRPEFTKLTPLYPNERLRLETEPHILTTRVIDLVMPIGKGQRALVVSPPKAGKTMVLQSIANAITTNNPECHLMVVLVDERPEEVTDMQRSVKGEVIASTFDR
ncbi:MAG TPA: Rho termination factor N-terminal domain-containing protein, partial [Pseudonocardiaceae bacterium]